MCAYRAVCVDILLHLRATEGEQSASACEG